VGLASESEAWPASDDWSAGWALAWPSSRVGAVAWVCRVNTKAAINIRAARVIKTLDFGLEPVRVRAWGTVQFFIMVLLSSFYMVMEFYCLRLNYSAIKKGTLYFCS